MRIELLVIASCALGCTSNGGDEASGGGGGKADDGGPSVAQCNVAVFGVEDPGPLEPLWAQNYAGSGLLRDSLLTPAERAVRVTIANSSESTPSPEFRALYPDAIWGRVDPDSIGDSHSHNTTALVLGPFASSMLPGADGQIVNLQPGVDIETNQGGGCGDPSSSRTLRFGSAGNSAIAEHATTYAQCLWVGSVDPLGYASDFSSGQPGTHLVATYADLSIRAMHDDVFGGTSAASPVAAGIGAHLRKAAPELDADTIIEILRKTADVPRADDPRRARVGAGRLNLVRALAATRAVRDGGVTAGAIDDAFLASLAVETVRYADVRALATDCEAYADGVRELYTAALLEPEAERAAKRELAAFYRAHGVMVSALFFERAAPDDVGLVAVARAMFGDRDLAADRRGVALAMLARAGVYDTSQLLAIGMDAAEHPFISIRALRLVGMQSGTTEAMCRRMVEIASALDVEDEAQVLTTAQVWSEAGEPLISACEALGISWE